MTAFVCVFICKKEKQNVLSFGLFGPKTARIFISHIFKCLVPNDNHIVHIDKFLLLLLFGNSSGL
jgi:hypothetical protein